MIEPGASLNWLARAGFGEDPVLSRPLNQRVPPPLAAFPCIRLKTPIRNRPVPIEKKVTGSGVGVTPPMFMNWEVPGDVFDVSTQ